MRIAITGRAGQVARAMGEAAAQAGVELIVLARPEFDLECPETIGALLEAAAPDVLVNAAAYTAVDKAEQDEDRAMALNAHAPGILAAAAARRALPFVHLSTDYVFDGTKTVPYHPTDDTAPLNAYGRSKRAGEGAVRAENPRHVIVRTSWVYDGTGRNFLTTMRALAATRPEIAVVSDQFGCPTFAPDLARGLIGIARAITGAREDDARFGTHHLAGAGDTSWAGFAAAIFDLARVNGVGVSGVGAPRIRPIRTADYPTPATRPANSRLDCASTRAAFDVALPFWGEALARCLAALPPLPMGTTPPAAQAP